MSPDKQGGDPPKSDSDNDWNQTLGDGNNVGVNDRLLLFLGQFVDRLGRLSDEFKGNIRCSSSKFLVEVDGLNGIDDSDTESGSCELGKGDETSSLG